MLGYVIKTETQILVGFGRLLSKILVMDLGYTPGVNVSWVCESALIPAAHDTDAFVISYQYLQ